MRILFINYNYLPGFVSPSSWLNRIMPSVVIMEALAKNHHVNYIGQIGYEGNYNFNGVKYHFFDPGERSRFPGKIHAVARKLKPDLVIIPGFHFPLQVMQLRFHLGKKVMMILEHHADRPFKGMKKRLQQLADRYVDGYHFTSLGNANEWVDANIFSTVKKCYEVPANSSYFKRQDKQVCRKLTGMNGVSFLWVGNLDLNKDPVTVLKAFCELHSKHGDTELHMIFQKDELRNNIELFTRENNLEKAVYLHGCIAHEELELWYNAADYFISASHREGGSIALLEAMSCGCIPIVSNIPSSLKVIENGKYGLHFEPGKEHELLEKLLVAMFLDKCKWSDEIEGYFMRELSGEAVAGKIVKYFCQRSVSNSHPTLK